MAGSSLLLLIDDIAAILDDVAVMAKVAARKSAVAADDVAVMTKVAAQKTAGVLGDDLALNAQQVTGVRADRELPVVWAVAKGSFVNKAILVPAALAISALASWLITPLLMAGGAFLCFEGAEKLLHKFFHAKADDAARHAERVSAVNDPAVDLVALEKEKIKGAVRTDFILSAEIIVISLGTVAAASFAQRVSVLVGISILMTLGVYGLVAGIVKLDDLGLYLTRQASAARQALGRGILTMAPWLMKALAVLGTAAMFLVGGGILVHGVPALHHGVAALAGAAAIGPLGGLWQGLAAALLNGLAGVAAGAALVGLLALARRLRTAG